MAESDGAAVFEEFSGTYDTKPPVPVNATGAVSHSVAGEPVPEGFVDEEHVAEVDGVTVIRAGIECPRCASEVFLHPESVVPSNTVYCYTCAWSPLSIAWWETPRLSSYESGGAE